MMWAELSRPAMPKNLQKTLRHASLSEDQLKAEPRGRNRPAFQFRGSYGELQTSDWGTPAKSVKPGQPIFHSSQFFQRLA
jgi:hypothetical protein